MDINILKDKKVYHVTDSDLDGISCRIVSEYFLKNITKDLQFYCNNDRSLPKFDWDLAKNCDVILFTDITPTDIEFYNKILELKKDIYIFDHHISGREVLGELPGYFFDIEKCGAKIFFDEITENSRVKNSVKEYVDLVNVFDLYKTDHQKWRSARALSNIMYGYVDWKNHYYATDNIKYEKFIDVQLKKFNISNVYYFTPTEKEKALNAEKKEKENFNQALKNIQFRVDGEGNKYAYTECGSKISWTAHCILKKYTDLEYIVIKSTFNDKRGDVEPKISIRSEGTFNCAFIAQKHGGGGHKSAAGVDFKDFEFFSKFREGKVHLI